jgi:uncharacterized membrane protein YfhO
LASPATTNRTAMKKNTVFKQTKMGAVSAALKSASQISFTNRDIEEVEMKIWHENVH